MMLRALFVTTFLFVLPLAAARADGPTGLGANAALHYWQAFATMPKFTDAEQTKLTSEYLTMPLDAHARELVGKSEYALRCVRRGAALPNCEWAIDWKGEGIDALLPQMNAARVLSTLACLRARWEFEAGQNAEAIDDLVAALTLGRHGSLDGSLIGILVGYSIEARVSEALAIQLPKLSVTIVKDLKKRFDALPAGGQPAAALRACEETSLDWFERKVKGAKNRDSLLVFLRMFAVSEGKSANTKDRARAFLAECGGDAAGVLKFAEEARPSYARMAKSLELPMDQFEKEFEAESKAQAGNPVFKVFFPALAKFRGGQARAEVRRALFRAALAVQIDGRDALKDYPDPVGGASFEYVAFDGGYELRSKFKGADDKPVGLTVGVHAK
jgi:hypothetical protein